MAVPANPMTVQPMDVRGEALLQPAYEVIEEAISDKAFPGATLAVGYRGKVALHAFGKSELRRESSRGGCATRCTTLLR